MEHLKNLIDNAKNNGLKAQYDDYAQQRASHEALIVKRQKEISENRGKVPTNRDIKKLLEHLKQMKVYGGDFKKLLDQKDAQVLDQSAIPVKVSKGGSWKRFGSWMGRQW